MDKIVLDEVPPGFKGELAVYREWKGMTACFTCMTCASSCPVAQVEPRFNPIRIIRLALLGLEQEVLTGDDLWLCSGCYTCQERCPNNVPITEFLTLLKNLAVQAGNAPQGIRAQEDLIKTQGRIYPLDDFDNKKRQKIDLPPLPTSCEAVDKLFTGGGGPESADD
jgi:heterodisulfide reductase subunit C